MKTFKAKRSRGPVGDQGPKMLTFVVGEVQETGRSNLNARNSWHDYSLRQLRR